MIKIVSIGNSFSQDATRYLKSIAAGAGIELEAVNLYIPGCSLFTHAYNTENNVAAYERQIEAVGAGEKISIKTGLTDENPDYVTLQQVSGDSGMAESFFPYLYTLTAYVTLYAPRAKQLLHKTWAYETGCTHGDFAKYGRSREMMQAAINDAYSRVSDTVSLPVIPVGDVVAALRRNEMFNPEVGGASLCRDGFHLDYCYGRYAAGATWFEYITGCDIRKSKFSPEHDGSDPLYDKKIALIRETVHNTVKKPE